MNLSSLRALELLYNTKSQRPKRPKTQSRFFLGILFLVVLSAACGKRSAQVKAPAPKPAAGTPSSTTSPPAPPSKGAKSAKPPLPSPEFQVEAVEMPGPGVQAAEPAIESTQEPTIRIGLITSATEARISSEADFYVMDKAPESSRKLLRGEIRVRIERQGEETSPVYQIQVGSFSHLENAEALKEKLSDRFDVPVSIRKNPSSSTNQVRLGEFRSRKDAESFLQTLTDSEFRRAFVVREASMATGGKTILSIRGSGDLFQLSEAGFLFLPSSRTGFLCVNGKPYRGLLDAVVNENGTMTVVNQVGIEEYLLGVVPAEISPSAYPEYEALAALAIAARTYALHHRGRYKSEGYDLTDDTNTQVYGGVNAEEAATDKAVRETRGIAIYYENKPIDAMYMSTCGGRTEDFSNVYDADPVPYLKSVFCAINGDPANGEIIIEAGNALQHVIVADDGSVANRNLELARILGLFNFDSQTTPEFFKDQMDRNEIIRLLENAKKIVKKASSNIPHATAEVTKRAGFLQFAAEAFFGSDEIKHKISPRDVDYYTSNLEDGSAVSENARYALAFLMQRGLWNPYPDNTVRPDIPIRRCDALSLLMRWVESARPDILQKATFVKAGSERKGKETEIVFGVRQSSQSQEFPLSKKLSLFRLDLGRTTPLRSLRIIGNEKIAFHVDSSGAIDFLEMELNPTGASSDRYSPEATWNVTFTRSALADKLRGLTNSIGEFVDIKPSRIGESGRVVQVQVVGSRRSVDLLGYRVRGALGLKDTLYTITREHNWDGSIAKFTFNGRGFGHGIGLCQVGAFGMAREGRSHEEILKHYYQGIEIRKAY